LKVTKKSKFVPVHAMKPYGGPEEKRHTYLTWVPNAMSGGLHCSDRPEKICPDTRWIGGLVDLRDGLDVSEEINFLLSAEI
jgi:hypothetical protein